MLTRSARTNLDSDDNLVEWPAVAYRKSKLLRARMILEEREMSLKRRKLLSELALSLAFPG
jgi:hypothetical protein